MTKEATKCATCKDTGFVVEYKWNDKLKRQKPERVPCKACAPK